MVVCSHPYRLHEHKKKVVQTELESMLPIVPKSDNSIRFCVDYHKVNAVSKFNAYPMPWVDELLDRLGTLLLDIGFNERMLADTLIAGIQIKDSLHDAVWIAPIC